MNSYLNYLIESNLAIGIVLLIYTFLFRRETNFSLSRFFLLGGLAASVFFPLFHITLPGISSSETAIIPASFLPELVVQGTESVADDTPSIFNVLSILGLIYLTGCALTMIMFLLRIILLVRLISKSKMSKEGSIYIAETSLFKSSFSFFNYIFIASDNSLNETDRQRVLAHECVHARQLHSLDIIIINLLQIAFWFNPCLWAIKKLLTQLHEFEADARSAENERIDEYCNLLARVALLSADIRIANHFSNSLTLKRIQMLRTIKSKVPRWKLMLVFVIIPSFFFVLACQDQMPAEVSELVKSTSMSLDIPPHIVERQDALKKENPELEVLVVEISPSDDETQDQNVVTAERLQKYTSHIPANAIQRVEVFKEPASEKEQARNFVLVQYNKDSQSVNAALSQDADGVYTVVEESATPANGLEGFYSFLGKEIRYPKESRANGVQGKVFVSFVIETDGTLNDIKVVKGLDEFTNAEAIRVMSLSPKWNPGKEKGQPVRQRMVVPINFQMVEDHAVIIFNEE